MHTPVFELKRDEHGRLVCIDGQGQAHVGVNAVRAFPISAPGEGISLVDADGHELVWLPTLAGLAADQAALVLEGLTQREFMPVIERVTHVSSFVTPSLWDVVTDRGPTQLLLKGEENIRRIAEGVLLVSDAHGVQFLIRNPQDMDRDSRRLLDRFL
ncbi:hypothetical protein CCO03_10045 [Comamonas serinivorans]|uniref:DUF1854 domain-containing protein n=1 Tax=Comamonas serinivorans TaxID=1082851 RepID=A0A1Y0ENF7_9BURK|nr:DUF1854 domain-containing protein [Comamonas serinivorans]ARU04978.1 hypothetical protein CCO03_10045 [Comamonas serinivorans]